MSPDVNDPDLPVRRPAGDGLDSVRDVLQEYAAAFGQRVNLTVFDRGTGEVTRVEADPPANSPGAGESGGNINDRPTERVGPPVRAIGPAPSPEPERPRREDAPMITLVDIAAECREVYGERADEVANRKLPEHEWRFELKFDDGTEATLHVGATAADVAAYLDRYGRERCAYCRRIAAVHLGRHGLSCPVHGTVPRPRRLDERASR